MKTFLSVLGVIAVLALLIGFRQRIASFFGWNTPKDGDACTDSNGNTSTIVNGACKEVVLPPLPPETQHIIIRVPYGYTGVI